MLPIILFYLYNFAFTAVFVYYTKYQFQDEKAGWANSKGKWHKYGLTMRLMLVGAFFVGFYTLHFVTWKDLFLVGAIVMPLWDIMINKVALGMPALYNGSTSATDKKFKGFKWVAYSLFIITSVIIRFTY